jgi:hypothetical protein
MTPKTSPGSDPHPGHNSDRGSIGHPDPKEHAMFSELTDALIVDGLVLAAVLSSDLGDARKIGPARILRPLAMTAVLIPLFIATPVTHGTGLAVEVAGLAAGLLGGLAAAALVTVYRSPETGQPASRARAPYAIFWALVIGARAAFSYGADHWFHAQLVGWAVVHQVTFAAVTDALIGMAVVMVLVRTIGLGLRASHLRTPALAPQNA